MTHFHILAQKLDRVISNIFFFYVRHIFKKQFLLYIYFLGGMRSFFAYCTALTGVNIRPPVFEIYIGLPPINSQHGS